MKKATRLTLGACLALSLGGCQAIAPIQNNPSINAPSASIAAPVQNETSRPLDIDLGNVSLQVNLPIPAHAVRTAYSAQAADSYTYANVTDIRITVIGADIPTPIVSEFRIANGATALSRDVSIPAGKNRVFLIEAIDHNAPNHTFDTIAKIRAVADLDAGGDNAVTVGNGTSATGATFAKLIADGRNGNATALNLAKTMDPAAVQAWIGTNLAGKHATLVDSDKLAIYLRDNAGALPAAGTSAGYLLGGTLTVTLRNRVEETAVTDATMTLNDFASAATGTNTNTNGVYTLTDLTPGTWSLTITSPTRVPTSVKVTVPARGNVNATVDMDGDTDVLSFAGGGEIPYSEGMSAANFQMTSPTGVAVFTNPNGNITSNYKDLVYFTEDTNNKIYRVNADRTISLISTAVPRPYKMEFDHAGNLWVSSGANYASYSFPSGGLFRFDRLANGELSTTPTRMVANNTSNCGPNAQYTVGGFDVLPSGEVYFQARSEGYHQNSYIYKINTDGNVAAAGYPAFTPATLADIAVDGSGQIFKTSTIGIQLFVKDAWVNFVGGVAAGSTGNGVDRTASTAKVNAPQFLRMTADNGLYFSDAGNRALRMVAGNGKLFNVVGTPGSTNGYSVGVGPLDPSLRMSTLGQSAVDSKGNLYLVDTGNKRILTIREGDSNAAIAASF